MIWLASFPRSGNTFFRNVLYEVYGIESSTYHKDPNRAHDANFASFPVVKTHLLPHQLPQNPTRKSVYIVRDGRDSVVSLARHRSDIIEPGSDYTHNLLECILAKNGSHFGGWSANVENWLRHADIVIHFEDLIKDPVREVEKLRNIMELPPPNRDRLPGFKDLKFGTPRYGGRQKNRFVPEKNQLHFRKGKVGSYKEEMTEEIENLFLKQHGQTLRKLEYINHIPEKSNRKFKVLIEGSKYFNPSQDGVSRYTSQLIEHLPEILKYDNQWEIDLLHKNKVVPLVKAMKAKQDKDPDYMRLDYGYEQKLLDFKERVKLLTPRPVYHFLRKAYISGPWRSMLKKIKKGVSQQRIEKVKKDLDLQASQYDLIHATIPQGLLDVHSLSAQKMVTVHDITHHAFPNLHTPENIDETERGMMQINTQNAHAICVSRQTADDLKKHYHIPEERQSIIYEGINPDVFHPGLRLSPHSEELKKYGLPKSDFILCLSTLEPRKNLKRTIDAFLNTKKLHPDWNLSLVIAGKKGWKLDETLPENVEDRRDIVFTGFVDEADLPLLYSRAKAFCYASLYEGFGLPLLEAMSTGTPVIYGNNSSMKEIIGAHGMPVEATDTSSIGLAMYELTTNDPLWNKLSLDGRAHSNRFTWLKMAFETLNLYQKMVSI